MTPERWKEVERLYQAAVDLQPDTRSRFLAEACTDAELRSKVESLLRHRESGSNLLEGADVELAAEIVTGNLPALAGTTIDRYQVLSLIGKGGMGEVYKAHDPRAGREVAIKVSMKRFSERFDREVRAVAALNHPNICTLYDVGPNYLVMELIEGATLEERIKDGPIPLTEALSIARQIAHALEAAHEKLIVHRDLKPANIKIKNDGTVKVLDFGLAKMVSSPIASHDSLTNGVTATQAGMIVGTVEYMAPEQARGKPIDKRADIWAFGVVLYEMLTGNRPFRGDGIAEILAAVVTKDPDLSTAPAQVRRLLQRCLEKDPTKRLRDISGVNLLLEEHVQSTRAGGGLRRRLPWAVAAVLAIVAAISVWVPWRTPPLPRPVTRWTVALPDAVPVNGAGVALSPDGTRLAYATGSGFVGMPPRTGNSARLWLRRMDQFEAAPIPGTDGGLRPFFSPDGQSLAYFTGSMGALEKVSAAGGAPVTLCDGVTFYGGSWGDDGNIVFSGPGGLVRVAASGGPCESITKANTDKGEAHRWPQFLRGGRAVLFTIGTQRGFDSAQIAVLDLNTGARTVVVNGGTAGRYVPSGHLVYVRARTMFAVPFDLQRLAVTGVETEVVKGVTYRVGGGFADYAFSNSGLLIYATEEPAAIARPLEWVDRKGNRLAAAAPPQEYLSVRVSPDGLHMVAGYGESGNSDVRTYDFVRGAWTRLTSVGTNLHPIWTPDGRRIAFYTGGGGERIGLVWAPSDGGNAESLLSSRVSVPDSWTQDGGTLLYTDGFGSRSRIWVLSLNSVPNESSGERKPRPLFLETTFNESDAQISPDGIRVAYTSDESGKNQVYVRPFSSTGAAVPISIEGGQEPRWSRDGKELFYRDAQRSRLMVVGIQNTPRFSPSPPRMLFELGNSVWDVAPDGKRFLVMTEPEAILDATKLQVVDNWFEELRRKVPTKR